MHIKGETRPIIGSKKYSYTLQDPLHTGHFLTTAVDNTRVEKKTKWYESKPDKKEEVVTWKVYLDKKLVFTNTTGIFTFAVGNQKYTLVATVNNKDVAQIALQTLGGTPKIEVYWRDDYGSKITGKTVGYLDKIYLVVKTSHIPLGDTLLVTIYEDELADGHGDSSRNMATFTTTAVNKNGYASVYFNNLQVFKTVLDKQDKINEDEHEFYAQIVYKSHIDNIYDTIKDKELKTSTQLKVKNELFKYIDPPVNNMPVIVGEVETGGASENKKKVDFTFGVFLDGTLNNMYNTEVRKAAENKAQTNTSGLILSQADANKIYQKKGDPDDMESSYENDLSNPAILYKNYVQKTSVENQFSIYTEGVGTNSAPKKQGANMAKEDYKSDDLMSGPAFGMGSAGIMDGVKKAIIDAEKKIFEKLKPNEIIGTITFDVFGFSRGAASARHFVHVVTHAPYKPTVYQGKGHVSVLDLQNNHLHPSYQKKTMPAFGLLGQLLKEKDKLDPLTKVNVRFAGLYDTVPHHGLFQWNDIKDLGLNSINKADYVVHFIAADEHRANFSLVDISSVKKTAPDSKEKGGIERYYPGVHCDVGGAYEEGRPDNPLRIDAADFPSSLESLRQELIKQGWFKDKEIFTKFDITGMGAIMNIHRLEGKRARLSNQYSYIPLHHMAEICKLKNVPITKESVTEFKNFKENSKINGITGNVAFLTRIKSILHDYTFSGGKPLEIIEPPRNKPEPSNKEKRDIHEIVKDNTRVVKEVRLDIINDEVAFNDLNKDIRFLRNHYLHWNSTYGEKGIDIGVQKNYPRILNGKRERHVR